MTVPPATRSPFPYGNPVGAYALPNIVQGHSWLIRHFFILSFITFFEIC